MDIDRLQAAFNSEPAKWTLTFVGEDEFILLGLLKNDLQGPYSETGDGKRIRSGFAYWGNAPTVAWSKACSDPTYVVMQAGTASFGSRIHRFKQLITDFKFYVSLGVGSGSKDATLLKVLGPDIYYIPVDMCQQMLRIGVKEVLRQLPALNSILSIQLDFSSRQNVVVLRRMLTELSDGEPILFSLLGNTISNFEHDVEVLRSIAGLLGPEDRLLLEVATTPDVSEAAAEAAAGEYRKCGSFKQFAQRTILSYTDLQAGLTRTVFKGVLENNTGVKVKCFLQNKSSETLRLVFADYDDLELESQDTIRLYISRKYTDLGRHRLLDESGLSLVDEDAYVLPPPNLNGFGLNISLLKVSDKRLGHEELAPMSEPTVLAALASAIAAVKDAPGALQVISSLGINLRLIERHRGEERSEIERDNPLEIVASGLADELTHLAREFASRNPAWDEAVRHNQRKRIAATALVLIRNGEAIMVERLGKDQVMKLSELFGRYAEG